MISSPAGNDLLFDVKEESTLKQGSFFVNKMWNALKLIKMWGEKDLILIDPTPAGYEALAWPGNWFRARLAQASQEINALMNQFRLSEALKTVYSLIWDDYCSWYLEWIKPDFNEPMNHAHLNDAIEFFEKLMLLLHPFMPFVTEEIYQQLRHREEGDDLCQKTLDTDDDFNLLTTAGTPEGYLAQGELLKQVITSIRDVRNKQQLKPKDEIEVEIASGNQPVYTTIAPILAKQVNGSVAFASEARPGASAVAIEKDKFFIYTNKEVDTTLQKSDLLKDLEYQQKFLDSVNKKLANERFVQNAKPEVVDIERKKKADAEARIKAIEESLQALG